MLALQGIDPETFCMKRAIQAAVLHMQAYLIPVLLKMYVNVISNIIH